MCRQIWEIPENVPNDQLQIEADCNADFAFDLCVKFIDFSAEFVHVYLEKKC